VGSSNGNPPERCPRPLHSQDSTQEHQEIPQKDQSESPIKVEVKEEPYVMGDDLYKEEEMPPEIKPEEEEEDHAKIKEEEVPIKISTDGSSDKNPPERCPHPLYSRDSTQEDQEILQEDNVIRVKVEVKVETEEPRVRGNEPCEEEEEIPPEIS
ncbi:unnamed protein product, partial [Staurois parvus]